MVNKLLDMTGMRFGRLTVVERAGSTPRGQAKWLCSCDCGKTIIAQGGNLRSGLSKSCGCISREKFVQRSAKHGHAKRGQHDRLYSVWRGMIGRCYDSHNISYRYYGGRGVSVCDEWREDFLLFREWALANGYDESASRGDCTLDRIDPFGNYEPSNCRWVDMKTQNQNRRKNHG